MFSLRTIFAFVIFANVLEIIIATPQTFEKSGENYHAKVTIHRDQDPHPSSMMTPPPYRADPAHPWRQGDRITKQEVVQNLAKALLTRKMTSQEMQTQARADNARKLEEYTLQQARKQHPEYFMNPQPQPAPNPAPAPGITMMQPQQRMVLNGQSNQNQMPMPNGQYHILPPGRPNQNQMSNRNELWTQEYMPGSNKMARRRRHPRLRKRNHNPRHRRFRRST